jgi:glutamine cyclotransferase
MERLRCAVSSWRAAVCSSSTIWMQRILAKGSRCWGDLIYQLTWQNGVGFVYDRESFQPVQQFSYPTEGWGLTHDGEQLILSDGTATLYFLDPATLQETGRVTVTLAGACDPSQRTGVRRRQGAGQCLADRQRAADRPGDRAGGRPL